MMLVKTCCGCISLQRGVITIGSLSLISAVLNAILMGGHVNAITRIEDTSNFEQLMLLKWCIVAMLIYILVGGISSALMIAGSVKRVSGYFFPWLALGFSGLVGLVAMTMAFIVVTSMAIPLGVFFACLLFLIAAGVLHVYLWLVVYSHYKEVVAEKYGHQTRPSDGKILSEPTKMPYYNV